MLKLIMDNKGMSVYALSQKAGIPYSTLSDIVSGKTDIQGVSASALYKLSTALGVSMEDLYLGKQDTKTIHLYNQGRNVIIHAGHKHFSYLGPKNLVGFRNITDNQANVLYVDTYFTDERGRIYVEEDYIDLKDIMRGYEELLQAPYDVVIGSPGESRTKYLIENSLFVSDNMAVMPGDNGTTDIIVEIINLKRNTDKMILRLKDYAVLFSNMSGKMEERAKTAVERNIKLLTEELKERKHA